MDWHPYAKLFPMLGDEAIEALAEDIRQNGLRTPIIVDTHERIIDGRNRSTACVLANVEPVLEVFAGNDREILRLVCSLNIHRRHLNESQRATIAATIANMPAHVTAAKKRAGHDSSIDPSSNPVVTQSEAAEMLNVGVASVKRASAVQKSGAIKEVKEDIVAGKLSVNKAAKVARLAPAEQQKARAAGYPKETPIDPPSLAMKYIEQAITILKRIRDDDDQRMIAVEYLEDWIVKQFHA